MPDPREQAEAVWRTLFPWPDTQCPVCGWTFDDRPTGCRPGDCWLSPAPDRKSSEAPPLESCLDDMRIVEDEIERRGLTKHYWKALNGVWTVQDSGPFQHFLIRATAAQRLEAAYRVIEEVGNAG